MHLQSPEVQAGLGPGTQTVVPELGLSSPLSFALLFSEATAFSARLFGNGSHGK